MLEVGVSTLARVAEAAKAAARASGVLVEAELYRGTGHDDFGQPSYEDPVTVEVRIDLRARYRPRLDGSGNAYADRTEVTFYGEAVKEGDRIRTPDGEDHVVEGIVGIVTTSGGRPFLTRAMIP